MDRWLRLSTGGFFRCQDADSLCSVLRYMLSLQRLKADPLELAKSSSACKSASIVAKRVQRGHVPKCVRSVDLERQLETLLEINIL
eukprot:3998709-Amphidinium_carterae.1